MPTPTPCILPSPLPRYMLLEPHSSDQASPYIVPVPSPALSSTLNETARPARDLAVMSPLPPSRLSHVDDKPITLHASPSMSPLPVPRAISVTDLPMIAPEVPLIRPVPLLRARLVRAEPPNVHDQPLISPLPAAAPSRVRDQPMSAHALPVTLPLASPPNARASAQKKPQSSWFVLPAASGTAGRSAGPKIGTPS